MKKILKMLVHRIDHAVAKCPQEKERTDQGEGEEMTFPIIRFENGRLVLHGWISWFLFVSELERRRLGGMGEGGGFNAFRLRLLANSE
jgi:hypothetical protein